MTTPNKETAANAASTTLNGSINNSVTSITVTDGSTFPILATSELFAIRKSCCVCDKQ